MKCKKKDPQKLNKPGIRLNTLCRPKILHGTLCGPQIDQKQWETAEHTLPPRNQKLMEENVNITESYVKLLSMFLCLQSLPSTIKRFL